MPQLRRITLGVAAALAATVACSISQTSPPPIPGSLAPQPGRPAEHPLIGDIVINHPETPYRLAPIVDPEGKDTPTTQQKLPIRPIEDIVPEIGETQVLPGEPAEAPLAPSVIPPDIRPIIGDQILRSRAPFFHRFFRELVFYRGGWVLIDDPLMWQSINGWVFIDLGDELGWTWIYIPARAYYYVYIPILGGYLYYGYLMTPRTLSLLRTVIVERRIGRVIVRPGREGAPASAPTRVPQLAPAPPPEGILKPRHVERSEPVIIPRRRPGERPEATPRPVQTPRPRRERPSPRRPEPTPEPTARPTEPTPAPRRTPRVIIPTPRPRQPEPEPVPTETARPRPPVSPTESPTMEPTERPRRIIPTPRPRRPGLAQELPDLEADTPIESSPSAEQDLQRPTSILERVRRL